MLKPGWMCSFVMPPCLYPTDVIRANTREWGSSSRLLLLAFPFLPSLFFYPFFPVLLPQLLSLLLLCYSPSSLPLNNYTDRTYIASSPSRSWCWSLLDKKIIPETAACHLWRELRTISLFPLFVRMGFNLFWYNPRNGQECCKLDWTPLTCTPRYLAVPCCNK